MAVLALNDLRDLIKAALISAGTAPSHAAIVADALTRAEADGLSSHGASRVPAYAEQVKTGKINGHVVPDVSKPKPGLVRVDAGTGFAFPAIQAGLEAGVAAAAKTGIALVAVANSHHFGVAGHHVEDIAEHGLIGLCFGNSPAAIAPWGGGKPLFGTNPIAFACPRTDASPLVIDLSLSKVARGKVKLAADQGEPIPEGIAVDANGNPTTDAKAAMAGAMLPMGDAKGAALVLMVELLAAALTASHFGYEAPSVFDADGPPPRLGQCLMMVDPGPPSLGGFANRVETLMTAITDQPGARLPGDRRLTLRQEAETSGLRVPDALLVDLRARVDDGANT